MRGCNGASVLAVGAMLLLGGASGSCDGPEEAPTSPVQEDRGPPAPPPAAPDASKKASQITLDPWEPVAGQPLKITSGPITFNNGCQGIASTEAKVEDGKITLSWKAKAVAPDAICTMALHTEFATATVEGLAAGTYPIEVLPSGGVGRVVVRDADAPAPEAGTRQ